MKVLFRAINSLFWKVFTISYPTYLIIAVIIFVPLVFIIGGVSGFKESIIDNKDLGYKVYKTIRSKIWKS